MSGILTIMRAIGHTEREIVLLVPCEWEKVCYDGTTCSAYGPFRGSKSASTNRGVSKPLICCDKQMSFSARLVMPSLALKLIRNVRISHTFLMS